jgi:hypothetical protein
MIIAENLLAFISVFNPIHLKCSSIALKQNMYKKPVAKDYAA